MNSLVYTLWGAFGLNAMSLRSFWRYLLAALLCCLAGCGSRESASQKGGGSDQYSISLPDSLDVTVTKGDVHSTILNVAFNGDGLIVGFPPGANQPPWLSIWAPGESASPARVELDIYAYDLPRGIYQTTLRFMTGNVNTGENITKDVVLTVSVEEPLRLFNPSFSQIRFESVNGSSTPSRDIYIAGGEVGTQWSLQVEYSTDTRWLDVSREEGIVQASNTAISIRPNTTKGGLYQATIVLLDEYGNSVGSVDVSYSSAYQIDLEGDIAAITLSPASTPDDLKFSLTLNPHNLPDGENHSWILEVNKSWLVPEVTEGNFGEVQTLNFSIDPQALSIESAGVYSYVSASITLIDPSGNIQPIERIISFRYNLEQVLIAQGDTYFSINQNSQNAAGQITIATHDHGVLSHDVTWRASSSQPWLRLINATGGTRENNTLTFEIDQSIFFDNSGSLPAIDILIQPDNPQYSQFVVNPEIVIDIPKVTQVSPNIHFSGQKSSIKVLGENFIEGNTYWFTLGDIRIDGIAESTSIVSAQLPDNLPAGNAILSVGNYLGLDTDNVALTIKARPQYSEKRWELPKKYDAMVLDPWRDAVFFYGEGMNTFSHVDYLENSADQIQSDSLSGLISLAMSKDGQYLLAVQYQGSATDIHWLDPQTLMPIKDDSLIIPVISSYGRYQLMSVVDGNAYLLAVDGIPLLSGINGGLLFPRALNQINGVESRDGTKLILADWQGLYVYDYMGYEISYKQPSFGEFKAGMISVSQDGTSVLIGNAFYDQHPDIGLSLFGELTINSDIHAAALAPSGSEAYLQSYESNQAVIYRYDLTGDVAREVYPADSEPLTTIISEGEQVLQMTVSDDGGGLFVLCLSADKTHSVFYTIPL